MPNLTRTVPMGRVGAPMAHSTPARVPRSDSFHSAMGPSTSGEYFSGFSAPQSSSAFSGFSAPHSSSQFSGFTVPGSRGSMPRLNIQGSAPLANGESFSIPTLSRAGSTGALSRWPSGETGNWARSIGEYSAVRLLHFQVRPHHIEGVLNVIYLS